MLITHGIKFTGTHTCMYTWVEKGMVRVKSFAQQQNTMSLARAQTQTPLSKVEHNHEATTPPHAHDTIQLIIV